MSGGIWPLKAGTHGPGGMAGDEGSASFLPI